MRKILVTAMISVGMMTSVSAFAEKYAVIDVNKAAADTNYVKGQMASLQAAVKPQQQKQEQLGQSINALRDKAEKATPAERDKLAPSYQSLMDQYNTNGQAIQKRVQDTLDNINKTVGPKIEQATDDLRQAGGYTAVLSRSAVVSLDPSIDLTSQVTQRVNSTLR